jgi:cyclic pyranopterin phosphate synthase
LTTNGSLLKLKAQALKDAGLKRVTVSLDSLDDATFRQMNDVDFPVAKVLEGIDEANRVGLPVKVNMVVKRGVNDQDTVAMARHFKGSGHILRFIEFMDVGHTNGWKLDSVVPSAELATRIGAELPIEPVPSNYRGEVAERWRYLDGAGLIGVIPTVTKPFCGDCDRVRLTADGQFRTCLFATDEFDMRRLLRDGADDDAIASAIRRAVGTKWAGHQINQVTFVRPRRSMSQIGG